MTTLGWDGRKLSVRTAGKDFSVLVRAYDSVTPEQRDRICGLMVGYVRREGHALSVDQERSFRDRFLDVP